MTDNLCYTWRTQTRKSPEEDSGHDERIKALVRFIARCAATADYHDLHNLIEDNINEENK